MSTTNEQGPEPGADLIAAARGVEPEGEAAWTPPPPPPPKAKDERKAAPKPKAAPPAPGVERTEQVGADVAPGVGHNSGGGHLAAFREHHDAAELHGAKSLDHRIKAAKALWKEREATPHGGWGPKEQGLPIQRRQAKDYLLAGEYLSQMCSDCTFADFTSLVRAAADWRVERDAKAARKAADERRKADEKAAREAEERRQKADEARLEADQAAWVEQGRMRELAHQEAELARKADEDADRAKRKAEEAEQKAAAKEEKVERRRVARAVLEDPDGKTTLDEIRRGAAEGGGEVEWYSPAELVEAARKVMGGIDLDPASCEKANEVVKATHWLGVEDDSLGSHWTGRVWLNPPFAPPLIKAFAERLLTEFQEGRTKQACWLWPTGREDLPWCQDLMGEASALLMPRGRTKFWNSEGTVQASARPCMILYLGPKAARFRQVFSDHGVIWTRGR